MINPKMNLLARAEKDGEPIHPGLRVDCNHLYCGLRQDHNNVMHCPKCTLMWQKRGLTPVGYTPNEDVGALIIACQKQGWVVVFVQPGTVMLDNVTRIAVLGKGLDNPSALIDATIKATATVADNWEKCNGEWHHNEDEEYDIVHGPRCDCFETGYVLLVD